MAHVIKKGSIKVPTQPKDYDLQATGLVFKSYDNQIALEFNVEQQNGTPADLLGANLRLLMFIYDEVDGMITKEPIPFITKNLITESFLNGQVVYILPEAMKAYNGMVEAYVYIEYPDGSTSDNLGFTFRMKRSAIDGLAQDKADYFIADFQQLLDGVKQETTDAVNEALAKVEAVSKNVSSAQNDLTILEDRIDQTNQQIGDLGKLKKMYSNSIDFGGYDYSGNPNLSAKLNASSFSSGTGATVADDNDEIVFTLDGTNQLSKYTLRTQTPLVEGKQYTISCEIMLETGFTGDPSGIKLLHSYLPGGITTLQTDTVPKNELNKWQKLIGTRTVTYGSSLPNEWYPLFKDIRNLKPSGKVRVRNIKIEEGSTATPYQPNLLVEPYNMCREYPNENIADPKVKFPIESGDYPIYQGYTEEELMIGQTYTITLKGTKPASQTFVAYNYWNVNFGDLKPVEGLTDVWSLTFTPTKLEPGLPKDLRIFQSPKETAGACQIDWLKIEKGNTRTPNISQFKYFGEGLKDSNNPNDYSWDVTPEYTEKGLNNAVNVYDPQRVEGLKNFADGIQIAGDKVISENDCTVYTLTKDNSQSFIDGYATFIKHGKEVVVNGTVKFKKAYAFGVPLDDEVPDEFIARIVHGMLTGQSGTNSVSKAMYVQKDLGKIMTNSEFAANEWFTFHGNYWVGVK
ncbi:BppU family phage baseplate upper protein [Enterococcus faecium]|uniref:BppU family phage baseplate upper protein n=3 Tax=Enterococcus faecium TaxID=1352 RepID=UPI0027959436|nr:BppU family phage baseplate upper protein [Enterococcus faecium]